ncbi:hypothetical protein, partial [Yersinia kristensenii]|uniref:hypothetical protein n=1 Tax=Yersinia kristensenii TaxID=28152 RepID=UPI0015842B4A
GDIGDSVYFTFKLWDWGRLGLDNRPRPVHIEHGRKVIQAERDTAWCRENLLDQVEIKRGKRRLHP